ncbi:MAG TPA: DUF3300 domain-containing protein [Terracidiphilus sp.]|nr:DUF3300 domain-containing protein [Terracidiphilus sp.]
MVCLIAPAGVGNLYAQEAAPRPEYSQLSYDQLDQLVAPIALYPDALVAQILAAATYSPQVVEADRFVQRNADVPPAELARMADAQPWDPSVKALVAFPSVLSQLDRNLDWTTRLGNAYYNQPQDVMAAVQAMRGRAYVAGTLRSTPQQTVVYAPADIVIRPVNPAVVYVPAYDPWVVYGAPVPVYPTYVYAAPPPRPAGAVVTAAAIGFTFGVVVGAFVHYGWGWGHWGCAWGPHPVIAYNHVTYVSRSFTVVNHGFYGGYDHSFAARSWNQHVAYGAHGGVYTDQRSVNNGVYSNTRTATGPHGATYGDQRSVGDGQYTNSRTVTGPHGASYTDSRSVGGGTYNNTRTATRANGTTYTDQRTTSDGQTTNARTYTGANGRTASSTTTRSPGENSTTITGPNGTTATRTVTGKGTGNATVTRTGPRGTRTHVRHRHE